MSPRWGEVPDNGNTVITSPSFINGHTENFSPKFEQYSSLKSSSEQFREGLPGKGQLASSLNRKGRLNSLRIQPASSF